MTIKSVPTLLRWSGSVFGKFVEDEEALTSVLTHSVYSRRFFTVLRLALPRTSIRDITYQGIVIPKGTVFFLNAWACNMGNLIRTI
jgi:hypothetical protein